MEVEIVTCHAWARAGFVKAAQQARRHFEGFQRGVDVVR